MTENQGSSSKQTFRRYRIGDYAHYMGVGRDFLKHYEKCGLLRADHDANGYRYYPFEGTSRILEFMRLRSLGFTVREMEPMLEDFSGEEMLEKLKDSRAQLEAKIAQMQAVVDEDKRIEAWFERRRGLPDDWEVTDRKSVV